MPTRDSTRLARQARRRAALAAPALALGLLAATPASAQDWHDAYRAGIAAITDEDPYAGLLVSMHGAGIYRQRYGSDTGLSLSRAAEVQPLVDAFVEEQESAFPDRAVAAGVDEELRWADYHRLQWFDRFSLVFCLREWDEPDEAPFELGQFTFSPLGPWRARVDPYPFAGPVSHFTLRRRLVPKRSWTQAEFRRAFFDIEPAAVAIEMIAR